MDNKSTLASARMNHVQHISAIINNPHAGIMNSIYNIITETFSDVSYTPDLTENTVIPSPLLPEISTDTFLAYCQSLHPVAFFCILDCIGYG